MHVWWAIPRSSDISCITGYDRGYARWVIPSLSSVGCIAQSIDACQASATSTKSPFMVRYQTVEGRRSLGSGKSGDKQEPSCAFPLLPISDEVFQGQCSLVGKTPVCCVRPLSQHRLLEIRHVVLRKLLFSVGVRPTQQGVSSRVPPEFLELLHVPLRRRNPHLDPVILFGADTSRLQGFKETPRRDHGYQAFLLYEGHVERRRLDDGNLLIEASGDGPSGSLLRRRIAAESLGRVTKEVSRELV
ncbi:hypothetical protein ANO14919_059790 [Xylariales sp. No.14919]|nr:hypothetical protein ANO14919_059790 [Xylariales sp. No.14919]